MDGSSILGWAPPSSMTGASWPTMGGGGGGILILTRLGPELETGPFAAAISVDCDRANSARAISSLTVFNASNHSRLVPVIVGWIVASGVVNSAGIFAASSRRASLIANSSAILCRSSSSHSSSITPYHIFKSRSSCRPRSTTLSLSL